MTGMEDAIEQVARVIRAVIENQADIVADGMHLDVQGVITPHWIAEALASSGLLAPAPLREEWGVRWDNGLVWAGLHRYTGADDEGTPVRRWVSDWEEA